MRGQKCNGLKCPLKDCRSTSSVGIWTRIGLIIHVARHFQKYLFRSTGRPCCLKIRIHDTRLNHIAQKHNGLESFLERRHPEILDILCRTLANAKDLLEQPSKDNGRIWNRSCPFEACLDHGVRKNLKQLLEHLGLNHFRKTISNKYLNVIENQKAKPALNQCRAGLPEEFFFWN